MISFDEARQAILAACTPLARIRLRLAYLPGHVLAEEIRAPFDIPRFDQSAVDGFGVKQADVTSASPKTPVTLSCIGTLQAGSSEKPRIQSGEAVQIFTGAPVPPTVDAVVMQEYCSLDKSKSQVSVADDDIRPGENIRRRGEEFAKGAAVLSTGSLINPATLGLLATLGLTSAQVIRKPRITFVVTGNELVPPGKPAGYGQIYESNAVALEAAARSLGIHHCQSRRAPDEAGVLKRALQKALAEADVIIPVGGVSVGEYDLVKATLAELGVETVFWKIALKPGKPVYFGTYKASAKSRRKLVFGLPGNPVSALVTFYTLVKPALEKLSGQTPPTETSVPALLEAPLRKKAGRMELVRGRARLEGGVFRVHPTTGQDSHMLGGLSAANCLIHMPSEAERLSPGEPVMIEWLTW